MRSKRIFIYALGAVLFIVVVWTIVRAAQLLMARSAQADAYLVLGGTALRERFAAKIAREHPERKILISGGSEDPCVWLIYRQLDAPMDSTWMEHCAQNTFENFLYTAPILEKWGVKKVLLVTDHPQVLRALPMGRLYLGSHGMWVDLALLPETLGDSISDSKMVLEMVYTAGWAVLSQVYNPVCSHVTALNSVDMKYWYEHGFYCQPQAGVDNYRPALPGAGGINAAPTLPGAAN